MFVVSKIHKKDGYKDASWFDIENDTNDKG